MKFISKPEGDKQTAKSVINSLLDDSLVEKDFESELPSIKPLLHEKVVAEILGCSVKKIQKDRWLGVGISFVKIGHLVRYRQEDIAAYIDEAVRQSTSDPGPVAA